jgi:hypothetical protein
MMPRPTRKAMSAAEVGLKYGFRSGLEEEVAADLKARGVSFTYEEVKLNYVVPARKARYTPDFVLPNGIIVETKGRYMAQDRQKHLLVKAQNPELDIRFVFNNPNAKISKKSPTTYAAWCLRYGFKFAKGLIPQEWTDEPAKPIVHGKE